MVKLLLKEKCMHSKVLRGHRWRRVRSTSACDLWGALYVGWPAIHRAQCQPGCSEGATMISLSVVNLRLFHVVPANVAGLGNSRETP